VFTDASWSKSMIPYFEVFKMHLNMKTIILFALALMANLAFAQTDQQLVEKALNNYLDALYEAKPELIRESVHPKLGKYGFYRPGKDQAFGKMGQMTYERLEKLAAEWNAAKKPIPVPKKAEVIAVHERIAIGKVAAEWGFDYCQLVKEDGKWLIINIIWQSPE
jgi:Putative lumazine-binding